MKETKASLPSYKEKMAQAYNFALEKMGLDIQSHNIWSDYIKFLKNVEAAGTFAENQQIAAIRKVTGNETFIIGDIFQYFLLRSIKER